MPKSGRPYPSFFAALALCLHWAAPQARAQTAPGGELPAVEINTSVLADLPSGQGRKADALPRVILRPPESARERATASPSLIVPGQDSSAAPQMPAPRSAALSRPIISPEDLVPPKPAAKPARNAGNRPRIEQFPVVTRMRTESGDPSLPGPAPVAVVKIPPVPESVPVPDPKPVPPAPAKVEAESRVRIDAVKVKPPQEPQIVAEAPEPAVHPEESRVLEGMKGMDRRQIMAGVEDAVKTSHAVAVKARSQPVPAPARTETVRAARIAKDDGAKGGGRPAFSATAAPAPGPEPESAAMASSTPRLPPEGAYQDLDYVSVAYSAAQIETDDDIQGQIKSRLLPLIGKYPDTRLQIQAFASERSRTSHESRQRSLARALAAREYLIGQGVDANRVDIRAMGSQSDRDPLDRIDFILLPTS